MGHDIRRIFTFWGVIFVMIPGILLFAAVPCFCVFFWPLVAFCTLHYGKGMEKHHTQVKYMARLQRLRKNLERRTIEEWNERRWKW